MYVLPIYVAQLYNINNVTRPWLTIMATVLLMTVPLKIVFFLAQQYILENVVITGLEG